MFTNDKPKTLRDYLTRQQQTQAWVDHWRTQQLARNLQYLQTYYGGLLPTR